MIYSSATLVALALATLQTPVNPPATVNGAEIDFRGPPRGVPVTFNRIRYEFHGTAAVVETGSKTDRYSPETATTAAVAVLSKLGCQVVQISPTSIRVSGYKQGNKVYPLRRAIYESNTLPKEQLPKIRLIGVGIAA